MTVQTKSAFFWKRRGPGWRPYTRSPPSRTASGAEAGMPRASRGVKAAEGGAGWAGGGAPGREPKEEAEPRPPQDRGEGFPEVGEAREDVPDLLRDGHARLREPDEDLGDGVEADDEGNQVHAAHEGRPAEREARLRRGGPEPDQRDEVAEEGHGEALGEGPGRERGDDREGEHHEAEILGWPEPERLVRQEGGEEREADHSEGARKEGADGGDPEGDSAAPLLGHRVAVQTRRGRRHLAREVEGGG